MDTETLLTADAQDTTGANPGDQKPAAAAAVVTEPAAAKPADSTTTPAEPAAAAKPAEEVNPVGAPETYEAFKAPEGFALDEQLLGEFTPVLKELNLSQDAAQKVMDFAPKLVEATQQKTVATLLDQLGMKDVDGWAAASKADPEIGGEKFAENLGVAKKALDTFASPALKAVLKSTKLGDHPELLRAFFKVGKAISEDSFVAGGKTRTPVDPAVSFYPSMHK